MDRPVARRGAGPCGVIGGGGRRLRDSPPPLGPSPHERPSTTKPRAARGFVVCGVSDLRRPIRQRGPEPQPNTAKAGVALIPYRWRSADSLSGHTRSGVEVFADPCRAPFTALRPFRMRDGIIRPSLDHR